MKLDAPIEDTALTSLQDINQKLQFFGIFHGKPSLTSPALTTLTLQQLSRTASFHQFVSRFHPIALR